MTHMDEVTMKSTAYHVVEFNERVVDSNHCHIFVFKACPQHKPTDAAKTEKWSQKCQNRLLQHYDIHKQRTVQ